MGGPHRAADAAPEVRHVRGRFTARLTADALVAERPRNRPEPARAIARGGAGWPQALADLPHAPARVWLRGADVPERGACVALVGSRAASSYGVAMARRLAADLAALGWTVVSGLARGIDAAAHRGALDAGGRTVAVVPSALDRITPPEHGPLADEIAERGTLLSEVGSGGPFGRGAFVRRNRLIAALSAATVVVEAAERSGALSTAAAALSLGLPVFAVPGDVDRPTALGCLALLRSGARPCGNAGDVTAVTGPARGTERDPEAGLAAALDRQPRTLDDLAARAGLEATPALAALLRLEWAGVALACPGQRWKARA